MPNTFCDIDKSMPAVARVTVIRNGQEQVLNVCENHLRQLQEQQRSPLEQMFGNQNDSSFSEFPDDFGEFSSRLGHPLPRQRESVDISQYFSEHTKELIEQAAQTAVKFGRSEVDTEHLLFAISDSDIVKEILKQFKVDPKEIKDYIETTAPKGQPEVQSGK